MNKIVKIKKCTFKLTFVKAIKDVTKKSLLECKNIADSVMKSKYAASTGTSYYEYGTLLLNESSITVEQWEKIAEAMDSDLEWEYIERDA